MKKLTTLAFYQLSSLDIGMLEGYGVRVMPSKIEIPVFRDGDPIDKLMNDTDWHISVKMTINEVMDYWRVLLLMVVIGLL